MFFKNTSFIKSNYLNLKEKIIESLTSIIPVSIIVFLLSFLLVPIRIDMLMVFIVGSLLLILGMGMFMIGADMAMMPIGEFIGAALTKSRKLWSILFISFLIGTVVTISEPDLHVLAEQVPNVPNMIIILSVALGVGLFLLLSVLRIFLKIRLSILLAILYGLTFIFALFVPDNFLSVAFDAGGVTTGPITVPFIMALGIGFANMRNDKDASNDSFGLVALCSVGPILAVMILSMVYKPSGADTEELMAMPVIDNSMELFLLFKNSFPHLLKEVSLALFPIIVVFLLFQAFILKLGIRRLLKISIGILYTYLGLVVFFVGVNVGFIPVGNYLGKAIGSLDYNWIIVPIGMVIGYFAVEAEPAVHILTKQVSEITMGVISRKALTLALCIGVSISIGLAMFRIIAGIPLMYLLVPGYLIAVSLIYFVPPIFTAIAFDSGGVTSGPITATFLLPLAIGVCKAVGGDIVKDAFGVVSMVAMTPLITIQLLGLYFRFKTKIQNYRMKNIKVNKNEEIIKVQGDL